MAVSADGEGNGTGKPAETEGEVEFHDADTDPTAFTPTLSGPEWREMHVLLEITYKTQAEASTYPTKHLAILTSRYDTFPKDELIIYDNKSRKINQETCGTWTDLEAYNACFNIYEGYGRQIVIFRICTTQRFGNIKRAKPVWEQLRTTGCYF